MFDLIDELKHYVAFDQREQENVEKTLEFLKNNQNCYDRSNLSGHITAGAFICDTKGNILLNHHKATGMWFQFGGHCDKDSDCLNVAKREVMEETGITKFQLGKDSIFDVSVMKIPFNARKNEPEHWHYDINFLFLVDSHNYLISNESLEIKWVTIEETLKLINKQDHGMKRMVQKYQKILQENLSK